MSTLAHLMAEGCGMAVTSAATAYAIMAAAATLRRRHSTESRPGAGRSSATPAVTVLKPLCGAEPQLFESLRSFCDQSYPRFQVVFGVRDPDDAAVPIVRRLQRDFPGLELDLVIDATEHGSSLKVSNLINMMRLARHDHIVIADSDVRVGQDYLRRVLAPLADPQVGIVTCPYRGLARGGGWSLLIAAFINDWFMPSVFVAAALGSRAFVSGVTIALRRDVLEAIGGLQAIADQLADDYRLGELTRAKGLRTVLSDVVVDTWLHEASALDLIRHELRWLRTIRAVRPGGYASSFVTFALPVAVLGCLLAARARAAVAMLAVTAAARLLLHFDVRRKGMAALQLWVLPASDSLAFTLWCWGFVSRRVHWRRTRYRVARDGTVSPIA
ncbi:MAG: bacteriohopanetetrol glucosamine biosynthesis glycosyltransferase HpnI [Steroidobacteraceae bacterium]